MLRQWGECPPQNETLSILAQAFTNWRPAGQRMTHRESLEARWEAGAMNAKQLFEAMGGALSLNGQHGKKLSGRDMPGIGPFPGNSP